MIMVMVMVMSIRPAPIGEIVMWVGIRWWPVSILQKKIKPI